MAPGLLLGLRMDLSTELSRTPVARRDAAADFARPKPARSDREEPARRPERSESVDRRAEDVERADSGREERENAVRGDSERFSTLLSETEATLGAPEAPVEPVAEPVESQAAPAGKGEPGTRGKAEGEPESALPLGPQAGEPPALEPRTAPASAPQAAALPAHESTAELPKPRLAPQAAALPSLTIAPDTASSPSPTEALASSHSPTSRVELEKALVEADSGAAQRPAPHTDNAAPNQTTHIAARTEAPSEGTRAEAPRETLPPPSAREMERAADILRQVRVQITPQLQEARIHLQPAELGRVSIHLSVEEGRLRTTVRAEKRETLAAIQTHLPELRAALREQGIDAQEFQLALGFEHREQDQQQARAPRRPAGSFADSAASRDHAPALRSALAATGVDVWA